MYATIRRYSVDEQQMDELLHKIDTEFAEMVSGRDGFVAYQALDGGDGHLTTITVFTDEEASMNTNLLAAQWIRDSLGSIGIERTEAFGGSVAVSRAAQALLEPAHH
jgi:hypothetical protein